MKLINDINDPRIQVFTKLRNRGIDEKGYIIVESEKVILKLLSSQNKVLKIFAKEEFIKSNSHLIRDDIELYSAPKEIMKQIVGADKHHGVFAQAELPAFTDIDKLDQKVLILNGLTSPENVGSIIRSAAAFNINSLIYDSKTVSPFNRRCIRVSMGNIFSMKIHKTNNLLRTLSQLTIKGFHIYSSANIEESKTLEGIKFNSKSAVIIGSEGHGIDNEILEASDSTIKIPINNDVAHLNAGHASAILLYHLSLN